MSTPTLVEHRSPLWKKVLAWGTATFGFIAILAALDQPGSFGAVIGMLTCSAAIIIPGGWWLWCEYQDERIANQNAEMEATNAALRSYLRPEDQPFALALDNVELLPPYRRRWRIVAPAATATLLIGAMLLPPPEEDQEATPLESSPTSTSPTETAALSNTVGNSVPETSSTEPTSDTTLGSQLSNSAEPAQLVPDNSHDLEPALVPQQSVSQAPLVEPPIREPEPVEQGSYYRRCDDARAAGVAPLYAGEPGYRHGLDRDNDGIACEW